MKTFTKVAREVLASTRDDFDFHDPDAGSVRVSFRSTAKLTKLDDVCSSLIQGKTPAKSAYTETGVRILKVKNVGGYGIRWEYEFFVTEDHFSRAVKARVEEGDILMLCAAHSKEYIGRCDLVRDLKAHIPSGKVCAVAELIIIRPDSRIILPQFLLAYLRLPVVQQEIIRMVKGQSAHLYPTDLKRLDVVVPSLAAQREIADAWTAAERDYNQRLREAIEAFAEARKHAEAAILALDGEVVARKGSASALPLFKKLGGRAT